MIEDGSIRSSVGAFGTLRPRAEPQINPATREWQILVAWTQRRTAECRARIDSFNLDDRQTCFERGRLAELKELLKLGELPQGPAQSDEQPEPPDYP